MHACCGTSSDIVDAQEPGQSDSTGESKAGESKAVAKAGSKAVSKVTMSSEVRRVIVMIAVDGSEQAQNAIDFYLDILYHKNHHIVLLNCAERLTDIGEIDEEAYERMHQTGVDRTKALTEHYMNYLKQTGIHGTYEFVVLNGSRPGQLIVDEAKARQATFIVTGSRGLNSTRRTLVGSVSDFILHNASCPVLICRDHGEASRESLKD